MVKGKRVINVYPRVFAAKFRPEWMKLDNEAVRGAMVSGLADFFESNGKTKAVIGLSGGLDSSVGAQVAVEALGTKNVIGVAMPYQRIGGIQANTDWQDAHHLARHLGIRFITRNITRAAKESALEAEIDPSDPESLSETDKNRLGNIKARQRMVMLMDLSAQENGLVVGTGNKSEIMIGYSTIFGDAACAINPLAYIYKTQEFVFARHIGMPDFILDRIPSAGLYPGQTDEGQLGFRYSELDPLCFLLFDQGLLPQEAAEFGFTKRFIKRVSWMHGANLFKEKMPETIKIPTSRVRVEV